MAVIYDIGCIYCGEKRGIISYPDDMTYPGDAAFGLVCTMPECIAQIPVVETDKDRIAELEAQVAALQNP